MPNHEDFATARELGRPLRDRAMEREWSEGISVFATLDAAHANAMRFRLKLGAYVVAREVPVDGTIAVVQTGRDPDHWTIYASSAVLLGLVSGEAVDVRKDHHGRSGV